ncbi:hypothetical protein AB0B01_16880 [Streptomyces sp. NPDC044571]
MVRPKKCKARRRRGQQRDWLQTALAVLAAVAAIAECIERLTP